jgi:glycerate dehydrogenase
MKPKIVVLDGFTLNPGDLDWAPLFQLGDVKMYDRSSPEEVIERCTDAEIVLTNKAIVSRSAIESATRLKYIGVLATGFNIVDVAAASERGIIVSNVPGYSTASVVQLTFSLLFEWYYHVQRHSDAVHEGKWVASKDFSFSNFPLIEAEGKTIGIFGYGSIGQRVASVARAFGMKVVVATRTPRESTDNVQFGTLNEMLASSDIVTLHAPLTPETNGLFSTEIFKRMKANAFLINTSRGAVINEHDLAQCLNEGVIAGAGIDVLTLEPPTADNPLLTAKNCIITPHIAWATFEARRRLLKAVSDNLAAFLSGKPTNVVNTPKV